MKVIIIGGVAAGASAAAKLKRVNNSNKKGLNSNIKSLF